MHKNPPMSPPGIARREFFSGMRDFLPLIMGLVPFGMVCGASARAAGIEPWQAFAMSLLIFAGSSQIVVMQLLLAGAPFAVIVATSLMVNLRFMMYAASIAPHLRPLSRGWKTLVSYLLVDQVYALTIVRYLESHEPGKDTERAAIRWYFLGLALSIWLSWQLSTAAGIVLGNLIPQSWSPDFIVPLSFIAMVVPLLSDRAMACAALTGGIAAAALTLPLKLNLIVAAALGIVAGRIVGVLDKKRGSARDSAERRANKT